VLKIDLSELGIIVILLLHKIRLDMSWSEASPQDHGTEYWSMS